MTANYEFNDYILSLEAPELAAEYDLPPSATAVKGLSAGERYVDTSTWKANPLAAHGGKGANLHLRWNNVPGDTSAIDVVLHLHGYIRLQATAPMLRAVAGRSGLDLSGRKRPTLAILPRGRLITPDEVQRQQAQLDELAKRTGKKPDVARTDVYTFPALWHGRGAGLEALIAGALQWLGQQRGSAALTIARLVITAHSGGGAALDRLVALHAHRRVCNPDEVHVFDALYAPADGLKSWVGARLGNAHGAGDSGLRVFFCPGGKTQKWSEQLAQVLPGPGQPLTRRYRAECTRIDHLQMPNTFGPALLGDVAANLPMLGSCAPAPGSARLGQPGAAKPGPTPAPKGSGLPKPIRAALPVATADWIRSTSHSALELIADEAQRRRFLHEIDWSREYFPSNLDAQGKPAAGRRAEELFAAMAKVVPERRVPQHFAPAGIRYHDVTRAVVKVPGQPDFRLFPEACAAFVRLREAAAADGVQLRILSSWRSLAQQQAARKQQPNPKAVARGVSAHMYGLAVDLNLKVPGLSIDNRATRADDKMANIVRMYRSPIYKWLALNGSRFGWFPYRNEPWHWEYNPPGFKARFEQKAP